jgi:hypothetical protein
MDEVRGELPDKRAITAAADACHGFKGFRNSDEGNATTRIQARLERGVGGGSDS